MDYQIGGRAGVVLSAVIGALCLLGCGEEDGRPSPVQTPAAETAAEPTDQPEALPAPAATPQFRSTEQTLEDLFKRLPDAAPAQPPDLAQLVGKWRGPVTAVNMGGGDDFASPPVAGVTPIEFTITQSADSYVWQSNEAGAKPRALRISGHELIASLDGEPDVRLSLENDTLVGEIQIETPVRGRMAFHAKRVDPIRP